MRIGLGAIALVSIGLAIAPARAGDDAAGRAIQAFEQARRAATSAFRADVLWIDESLALVSRGDGDQWVLDRVQITAAGATTRRIADAATVRAAVGQGAALPSADRLVVVAAGVVGPAGAPGGWTIDVASGALRPSTARAGAPEPRPDDLVSPSGAQLLTVVDGNLVVRPAGAGAGRRLTDDASATISYTASPGMAGAIDALWAPDERQLLVVRTDQAGVATFPVVAPLQPGLPVRRVYRTTPGTPLPQSALMLIDVATGARRPVALGDTQDGLVTPLGWIPGSDRLLVMLSDRAAKWIAVRQIDTRTGRSHEILRERSATFIMPAFLSPLSQSVWPVAGGFVFASEREGYRRLYRYDRAGRLLGAVSPHGLAVADVVRVTDRIAFFRASATRARPYDRQLHAASLTGGGAATLVTPQPGIHVVSLSPGGTGFISTHSTVETPPATVAGRVGGRAATIWRGSDAGLRALGWTPPERFEVAGADGRAPVAGTVWRPIGFDPARRYPVVEVIYGGYQTDFVNWGFSGASPRSAGMMDGIGHALIARGFVVVYMNSPGTPGRDKAYHDALYGRWPQGLARDHAAAIRALGRDRRWMDLSRVGVWGMSYGGHVSLRAMIDAPDLYRAGVAVAPSMNAIDGSWVTEPYLGSPAANPAGYAEAAYLARLPETRGPILLAHGTDDASIPWASVMRSADVLIRAGKDVEVMLLPGVTHSLDCCGLGMRSWMFARMTDFLERKLAPALPPAAPGRGE